MHAPDPEPGPEYDAVVFSAYTRMRVPAQQVLANGLPAGAAPRHAFFRSVLGTGDLSEAARVWSWLERTGFADAGIAAGYCSLLLEHREYSTCCLHRQPPVVLQER